jgi:hypothetical protein
MTQPNKIHKLYDVAFGALRNQARLLGQTLKALAQANEYSGKVLRRGTPGAFGNQGGYFVAPWPDRTARIKRYSCAGNSRDRRFMRRHPHHFAPVTEEVS